MVAFVQTDNEPVQFEWNGFLIVKASEPGRGGILGYLIQSLRWYPSQLYSTFLDIDNQSDDDLKLSFDFLPARHVRILAAVEMGLVFCRSQYPDQHYICKPTSRQWELIPNPNPEYFTTKIAMIVLTSNPLCFKIVRLSNESFDCEIFDSSVWAWKQSDELTLPYYEYLNYGHFDFNNGIVASGKLHWVTRIGEKDKLLSFDPYKESWESTSVPASRNHDNCWIRLTVYEGKLAILSSKKDIEYFDSVEVWIMKDCHGEKYWDKKYTIDLKDLKNEIGYSRPASFYNTDTLLMLNNFKNHQHQRLSAQQQI